jgi:hypothetical protein
MNGIPVPLIQVPPVPMPLISEDAMTTNEFYYLLLVIGGFGSFAVGTALAMLRYREWLRQNTDRGHPAE